MTPRFAFVAVMLAGGCARTWSDYRPYTTESRSFGHLVSTAVVAYEGDVEVLAANGGVIVGMLEIRGNGFASKDDLLDDAREEAANRGGTHVILAGESTSVDWAQLSPDRATTTFNGNTATTTFQRGATVPVRRHQAGYVIVRVPPEAWANLPVGLRPDGWRRWQRHRPLQKPAVVVEGPPGAGAVGQASPPAWTCTDAPRGVAMGMCFRDPAKCSASQQQLADQGYGECYPSDEAYCFAAEVDSSAQMFCHPTVEACRAQRDYAFGEGHPIRQECVVSQ